MKDYFSHKLAVIDENCKIGSGTKIWHFSHIMSNSFIGENCNIGQNVVISPYVKLGNNVKVQNNVSVYTGVTCEDDVFLGPSMVFTNVINPRSAVQRKNQYFSTESLPEELIDDCKAFNDESLNELYSAIKQLSEIDRAVILLYLEEKTYVEMAEIIGTNPNNIGVNCIKTITDSTKLVPRDSIIRVNLIVSS